jgi:para-nitrobenzyl esterase
MAMPAAKGLFHKVIIESGPLLHVSDPDAATAYARGLLQKLDLTESQVDGLQSVPADQLFALASGDRLGALRGPVVDGHSLPRQPWDSQAPEESATVPMMVGTCSHEGTVFASWGSDQALFNLDEPGLRARLVQAGISDAAVDQLLALYHRDHPRDSPGDLYFRIGADRGVRTRLMTQVERKIEQGKANVYVYQFDWRTPTGDGRLKAFHTAGLPLAMRLVLYPESEQLSRQIADAWAAFARTGDPSHPGIPEWPAYTAAEQATMLWDAPRCQIVNAPDSEIRQILRMFPSDNLW